MIDFRYGSVFDNYKNEIIVNSVNTEGVVGKGLAFEFKNRLKLNHQRYKEKCINGFYIGEGLYVEDDGYRILNIPTKINFTSSSKYEYIEIACKYINDNYKKDTVRIPPLGCGLGKLEWIKVREILCNKLKVSSILYPPYTLTKDEALFFILLTYIYHDIKVINYPALSRFGYMVLSTCGYTFDLNTLKILERIQYITIEDTGVINFDLTEFAAVENLIYNDLNYREMLHNIVDVTFCNHFDDKWINQLFTSLHTTGSLK